MPDFAATRGSDTFAGGAASRDKVDFHQPGTTSGVKVDLNVTGPQNTFGSGSDTFTSIEDLTGTDFIDILTGNGSSNTLLGMGGGDILDAGSAGTDRLEGGDGDDTLNVNYTGGGHADLYGGAGYDTFNIHLGLAAGQSVTAFGGDGDDRFNLDARGPVILSLGAGSDTVRLGTGQTGSVTIVDFKAGDQGDVLDLYAFLAALPTGWDRSENPFNSIARLSYANGSTTLQVFNGGWKDAVVMQGVRASDLTAYNLGGYPPDGSPMPGEYLSNAYYTEGTVGDDILIAGGSHGNVRDYSALNGGAGNDLLSGPLMTGGEGMDTFVIEPGGGGTIRDFIAGTDTIVVHGSSKITEHRALDGLLALRFDGGGQLVLTGLTWSDALLSSFIFDTAPAALPVIGHSATTSATRVVDNGLLTIAAGEQFYHAMTVGGDDVGGVWMKSGASKLDVQGSIIVEGGGATGVVSQGEMPFDDAHRVAHVHIFAGGQVLVTGGFVYGFYSVSSGLYNQFAGASITNEGLIKVVGTLFAEGIRAGAFFDAAGVTNTGVIAAYSTGVATGIDMGYGDFVNSGAISATGRVATGISLEANKSFLNSGTITATAGDGAGVAVQVNNYTSAGAFVNSGTLTGDYAFMVKDVIFDAMGYGLDSVERIENQASGVMNGDISTAAGDDVLTSAGHINGSIYMGDDNDSLVNAGTINGDIDLGDGNDTYSGAGGLDEDGRIYAGGGIDLVTAGAGSQYIFGEEGNDTLSAGDGDDWVDGGTGSDTLDGGAGYDTISFRSQIAAVTVDLTLGTAVSLAGTDHITGFEGVIGTGGADMLSGSTGDDDLLGEDGNDTLSGGAGSDGLVGGRGADTLTGGAGKDYFVYNAYDGEDVITDFTVGQDVLVIGGFFSWTSLVQDGADTLITLADGGTIRLLNVLPAALKPNDIVFGDSSTVPLGLDPGTPRAGGSTVYLSNDFRIEPDQAYDAHDQRFAFATDWDVTLDNAGSISVSSGASVWGVYGGAFLNEAGGALHVESWAQPPNGDWDFGWLSYQSAYGVADPSGAVDNRGLIKVTGNSVNAWGIYSSTTSEAEISNSGRIEVKTGGERATGIQFFRSSLVTNTGTIIVEGSGGEAWGIADSFGTGILHVVNSGMIQVSLAPGAKPLVASALEHRPIGLNLGNLAYVDNSGTIMADIAIQAGGWLMLNNSGTLRGDIVLLDRDFDYHAPEFDSHIINTGLIAGNITGSLAFDMVDLSTGTFTGTFDGGGGDDYLYAGSNGETFVGGIGMDTADFSHAGAGVTVATNSRNVVAGFGTHALSGVEGLVGSAFADTLTGDAGYNVLTGGKGDDTLTGGGGGDLFIYRSGDGHDIITDFTVAGAQFDIIDVHLSGITAWQQLVQVGADTKVVFSDTDWILLKNVQASSLTAANFRFVVGSDNVTVDGTSGNDILTAYYDDPNLGGVATLNGGDGNDVLNGGHLLNYLNGGAGDDYIYVTTGKTYIDGGDGIDTIDYSRSGVPVYFNGMGHISYDQNAVRWYRWNSGDNDYDIVSNVENVIGTVGDDRIEATNAANRLYGGDGNDKLVGWGGNDLLDGGAGDDIMRGGAGDDTYMVDSSNDFVSDRMEGVETDEGGIDLVLASATFDLSDVTLENLTLTGTANINASGNGLANILTGNSGNNRLDGSIGADKLIGGAGNDTYVVDNLADVVTEAVDGGTDTVISSITFSVASIYVENITLTGSLFLSATGNGMNNILTGNSGNNILNGSVGADTMIGGAGSDYYYVDNLGDVVTENAGEGTDMVYALVSYALGANIENVTLLGTGNLDATGNELNNFLFGTSGNNTLNAGAGADYIFALGGNDVLDGGAGADGMYGGAGNDTYYVDNFADLCNEQSTGTGIDDGGVDIVISSANFQLSGFIENLTLTGTAVVGAGNASNNIILGNASGNYLFGLDGTDTLNGGAGGDALYGGTGADTFVFDLASGFDVIGDFSAAEGDTINLHAYANGVVNGAGIVITASGSSTYVNMGSGNVIFVANASVSDVSSHIVW